MKVTIVKKDGRWVGLTEVDKQRLSSMRLKMDQAEEGECWTYEAKQPRSRRHMGFFFCKLGELFDRQERFEKPERLLDWLLVGAGWCDLMPSPLAGNLIAMPRSIAWDNTDERTFIEIHREIDVFLHSPDAQEYLWPHLSPALRAENIAGWLDQAEKNRQDAVLRMLAEGKA